MSHIAQNIQNPTYKFWKMDNSQWAILSRVTIVT